MQSHQHHNYHHTENDNTSLAESRHTIMNGTSKDTSTGSSHMFTNGAPKDMSSPGSCNKFMNRTPGKVPKVIKFFR